MLLILKKILSLIEAKIVKYWMFSWCLLSYIEILPGLPSFFKNGLLEGFFMSFVLLTVGVYMLLGLPVLRFLYESVNNLYIADFDYGNITILIAMVIFWTPIFFGIICIILLPFINPLITKEKENIWWLPSLLLIYLILLFFWRGKGLQDEDYFWLFLFPGIPIYTVIIDIIFRSNKD